MNKVEAIEAYKQAIRINPDDVEAHNNLGNAYGNIGMYEEAIAAWKQVIRIDPKNAAVLVNLGNAYVC